MKLLREAFGLCELADGAVNALLAVKQVPADTSAWQHRACKDHHRGAIHALHSSH